jgi:hypothetical protein
VALTLVEKAELLGPAERTPLLAAARQAFEQLDARPWLERVAALARVAEPSPS